MTNDGAYGKGLQRGTTWKWQPGVFPTTPLWKLYRKCHYREVLTYAHVVFWLDDKIQKFFNKCIASKICQRWDFSSCSLYRHYLKHHTMHFLSVAWCNNPSNGCTGDYSSPNLTEWLFTLYSGLRTSMGQFWMTSSTTSDRGVVKSGLQNWNKKL